MIYNITDWTVPVQTEVNNISYVPGLEAHAFEQALRHNPSLTSSLFADLIRQSKESGILIPATSYIVVENSAQWKSLQLKEKQKLSGHEVMELQEAPEPSWLLLAFLFTVILWFRSRFVRQQIEGLP
jgi:hypothetical protein